MLFHKKFHIIQILIFISLATCKEYVFSLQSEEIESPSPQHWQHTKSNSAISQNGLEIDVLQWRVIAENKESVIINLINPVWKHYKWIHEQIILPKTITISEVMKFRGESMVYIRITPWRIIDNQIETLINGEIQISVDENNVPISLYHPHLINGKKRHLNRTTNSEVQYLIICPNEFIPMAQKIADIHSIEVPLEHRLTTKIYTIEQIIETYNTYDKNYAIREYLINQIVQNQSLTFLLLLGDETHIPPILDAVSNYPSDDYYTTPEIFSGDPQLVTGRIPINNSNDANNVAEKIYNYIINPSPGIWRSKIALVADDMHRSCSINNTQMERSHTIYTDNLFDFLNPFVPVIPYYGIHYELQQTAGCTQPDLTQDFIQTINSGIALINYIGHGDNQSWGDEKYITKSRDLSLIHSEENKLAIWVAGTCSFGNYYENNSFMEELLIKENGAIAIIATTDGINYTSNWNFLESLFGINNDDGIEDFITNSHNYRLGELVWKAKNVNNAYKFHVFGDPALPLPFPKQETNLIYENVSEIHLLEKQEISFTSLSESQHSSIQIRETEKEILKIIDSDSLSYTIPGEVYTQMDFKGFTNCFRIPQDVGVCENCAIMYAYKENIGLDGKIETIPNISILMSNENFMDFEGPIIHLYQNNISIKDGSAIFPDFDVKITLNDVSGINLLKTIGHGIRYKFDTNDLMQIHGNEFLFLNCDTGSVMIPIPTSLLLGKHNLYIEAWDGLNNKSSLEIDFDLLNTMEEDVFIMNKVYPFPNPFSNKTHFTMISTHFPVNINIKIFSINGEKINTLNKYVNECNESFSTSSGCFITIEWDGKDLHGHTIANGAYFYQLSAETNSGQIFNNIYKLAKIK